MLMVWLHIVAGSIALVAGAIAMYALKGATLHRKSGRVFVYAMLVMSSTGAIVAATLPVRVSVIAGALTFYLVVTALITVRRPAWWCTQFDFLMFFFALVTGFAGIYFGVEAMHSLGGTLDGFSATPYFVFAGVSLIGAALDARMLLGNGVSGKHRIARHLWRMGFSMYIATSAFFLGQANLFPEPIRKIVLLAIPVIIVIVFTIYWLVRVLFVARWQRGGSG
jgi:uncharacterized membrane protein